MQKPTLINGHWTLNGRKYSDMNNTEKIIFTTQFSNVFNEHDYKRYKVTYWTRIGDDKDNHLLNILARSPEEAAYITQQQSKFIFKIFIDGKEYKTNRNNRGF